MDAGNTPRWRFINAQTLILHVGLIVGLIKLNPTCVVGDVGAGCAAGGVGARRAGGGAVRSGGGGAVPGVGAGHVAHGALVGFLG